MGMFDEQQLGTPSISLKGARKGLRVEGVILPQQQHNAKTGMTDLVAFHESPDTDDNGDPKLYPSGDPILVGKVLLQTELRNWDVASAEFIERAESDFPDEQDTGLRRWFVGSKYARDAVRQTFKATKRAPEIGGRFTLEVVGSDSGTTKAGEKYTFPKIKVTWEPADAEGRKIAEAYADTLSVPAYDAPAGSALADDEPPF
jgi:hypothetical protein